MKAKVGLVLVFSLLIGLTAMSQVRVTGHVSAEVVEAASIQNEMNGFIGLNGTESNIELGKLKVSGTENTSFDVSVDQALVYNDNSKFALNTRTNESVGADSDRDLTFSALMDNRLRNGEYKGNITVIVSYN